MRRSNRNIETFDISLMAVVTKAMGAFLVLMLLLMPYYSSGPIGQQAAADLAKKVEQADLKIREVIDKLNKASPEDLRKLLDEALKLLEEARKLISELKRANDALQAQVKRLEEQVASLNAHAAALNVQVAQLQSENQSLRAQVAQLQERIRELERQLETSSAYLVGVLRNEDCREDIFIGLYSDGVTVSLQGKKVSAGLNHGGFGDSYHHSDMALFNVRSGLRPDQRWAMIVVVSGGETKLPDGANGYLLKKASTNCKAQFAYNGISGDRVVIRAFTDFSIAQGSYIHVLGEFEVLKTGYQFSEALSPQLKAWVDRELVRALKKD